jgi:hypothetical protein
MREEHREKDESKGIFYEGLEAFAREKIRSTCKICWSKKSLSGWAERRASAR